MKYVIHDDDNVADGNALFELIEKSFTSQGK